MLNPNERCAVFIDIDNTLTSRRFYVPEENRNAIKRAREKGHAVFINTGRSWANIPDILREQFNTDGIIAGSGAYLVIDNEVVFSGFIPKNTVIKVAEYLLDKSDGWAFIEGRDHCYVISDEDEEDDDSEICIDNISKLENYLESDEIQVLAVDINVSEEFKNMFSNELSFFPMGTYYDCVLKGLSKATGLQKAIDILGIKRENTIAIGDGGNDIDMINYAGIGVAVKNAQPHILEAADYITDSNTEFGVAKAIEKFLL